MNKLKEGYLTLEAALIMPFVIAFYFFCIYALVYIYDLTLLSQDSYYICEKIREAVWEKEDESQVAKTLLRRLKNESPYLAAGNLSMSYSKRGYKLIVDSDITLNVPINDYISNWFTIFRKDIISNKFTYCIKPQNIMRMSYVLTDKEKK